MNDADVVMRTLGNFFCGPPYIPPPGFPSADPFLIQTNGSTSFLPVGSLGGAKGTSINDVGDVLGYYSGSSTGATSWFGTTAAFTTSARAVTDI